MWPQEKRAGKAVRALDGDLRADLDYAVGRQLEIARGVVGVLSEEDEQLVLPGRHAGARVGPYRAPRQEERRRHDVERPAELTRDGQSPGDVGGLHEAEMQNHPHGAVAEAFDLDPILGTHSWDVLGDDGQDHVVLMEHLVVLQTV